MILKCCAMAWTGMFRAFGAGGGHYLGLMLVRLLLAIIDLAPPNAAS